MEEKIDIWVKSLKPRQRCESSRGSDGEFVTVSVVDCRAVEVTILEQSG